MTLGHFRITLGALWSHFGCMKVDFQKTLIFPTDLNTFIKLWGSVGVALGLLWDNFWHMKVTLGAFWLNFGVTLGPLWAYRRRIARMMYIISLCVGAWWGQKAEMLKTIGFCMFF